MPNPYEQTARVRKAEAIATVLYNADASPVLARELGREGRGIVEQQAGIRMASDETWVLAIAELERRQARTARAAVARSVPADPFEGLPTA